MTRKQIHTPHTEHHAHAGEAPKDLDFERFTSSFAAWKEATVMFEAAVRRMRSGDTAARAEAQDTARDLARLHHEFMESSQPYFQAAKEH
ncbi:hypothetical protein QFZ42_004352 [Variovorax paradoxus]|uniref:hypothetical protein n=1 Tax=Variovorax paradoxus TaxID=34073 RepID=UPI00278D614B|nr:hypothetical protein [Variovorax paradoxus]MDQ0572518.1 hypothetical protein [Variovorax paradoxus]